MSAKKEEKKDGFVSAKSSDAPFVVQMAMDTVEEALRELTCLDCPMKYRDFALDVVLPRAQWLLINPQDKGVLCANCIVKRAAKIERATVAHLVIEVTPA